jgi:hypothetical protein
MHNISPPSRDLPPEGTLGYWILGSGDEEGMMFRREGKFTKRNWESLRVSEQIEDDDDVIFQSGHRAWVIQLGKEDAWTGIFVRQQIFLKEFGERNDLPPEIVKEWVRDFPEPTYSAAFDGTIEADIAVGEEE